MVTSQRSQSARLRELCTERLSRSRVILASNRGPVEYHRTEDGRLQARRGSGGVVTALSSLSRLIEVSWIASAMGEADREVARRMQKERVRVPSAGENLYLRFIASPRGQYHKFYNVFCNPLLWFLQHNMWDCSHSPNIDRVVYDAWENGYMAVNKAFAEAVIEEVKASEAPPVVLLNDYHLYLASGYIRSQLPDQVIQSFIHIPWPSPSYWQLLPDCMRQPILRSLCTSDVVGLQTRRDVVCFLNCCQAFVEGAYVDYEQQTVQMDGHIARVKAYPVSIDVSGLENMVTSPYVKQYIEKIQSLCGEKTIIRVDRLEPSKNILRGFRAFNTLLERYPEFRGRVKFIAFLVPTRTHLKLYQRYVREVKEIIESINNEYRTEGWQPIELIYENNYTQAIAGMCLYDVLLVNAVVDGMNLVAKEGPTVNTRDGVLILSEGVGAYEQLGKNALAVAPADLEGTTQAMYTALTMPAAERSRRALALKRSIEAEDLTGWLLSLLEDAATLIERRFGIAT